MPANEVFDKFKKGVLHSGSKSGPVVKNRNQAIAIKMSEQKKANEGNSEYGPPESADHPMRRAMRGKY